MGTWASRSLATTPGLSRTERLREYVSDARFRFGLLALDAAFWADAVRGWVRGALGLQREGFEDALERQMRGIAKSNFGVEIGPGAFQG
jgi:aarF domain-containing kinase